MRNEYKYDDAGRVIKITSYNDRGKIASWTECRYGENGKVTMIITRRKCHCGYIRREYRVGKHEQNTEEE